MTQDGTGCADDQHVPAEIADETAAPPAAQHLLSAPRMVGFEQAAAPPTLTASVRAGPCISHSRFHAWLMPQRTVRAQSAHRAKRPSSRVMTQHEAVCRTNPLGRVWLRSCEARAAAAIGHPRLTDSLGSLRLTSRAFVSSKSGFVRRRRLASVLSATGLLAVSAAVVV
jgi:hypothetical protein